MSGILEGLFDWVGGSHRRKEPCRPGESHVSVDSDTSAPRSGRCSKKLPCARPEGESGDLSSMLEEDTGDQPGGPGGFDKGVVDAGRVVLVGGEVVVED